MRTFIAALFLPLAWPAFATVTWNPSDSGAGTFSSGNDTITGVSTGPTNTWYVTRATSSYSTGKYYAESVITQNHNDGSYGSWGIGIANGTQVLNNYLGSTTTTGWGYQPNNGALLGNAAGTIQTCAQGNIVQTAIDFGAGKAWIACNGGSWNVGLAGTQNPTTGAGGIDITNGATISAPYFLSWVFLNTTTFGIVTTNFGSTSFTYGAPSGFAGFNTSGGASIAISPTSVTGGAGLSGDVITITGTSTSFTGTPFTVSGGLQAYISSQSVSSGTAGSITINPGLNGFGNITVTDTGSGANALLTVTNPSPGALTYGVIGDSISFGTNGNPVAAETTYLQGLGYTVTAYNQAISGTSTQDWVVGTSNLSGALTAFAAASPKPTIIQVMLGTNDTRTPYNFTVAYHHQCMASLVYALVNAGYKVMINKPLFTEPNANFSGVLWSTDPNSAYEQFYQADMQLVDGINVFQGDTGGFQTSAAGPQTFLASDGVHPANSTENNILGGLWGIALQYRWGNAANLPPTAGYSPRRFGQQ